jgi:hypothetical protein
VCKEFKKIGSRQLKPHPHYRGYRGEVCLCGPECQEIFFDFYD